MIGMTRGLALCVLLASVGVPTTAQAQKNAVEIPLRLHDGRLLVPVVAADGTEYEFALSTVNASTILTASTAAKIGSQAVTVDGLAVHMDGFATIPDAQLGADGMIASNTLFDYDVLIDVAGARLVLKPFGQEVAWEGITLSEPVRLQVLHGVIFMLSVELNDQSYQATIDLGTQNTLVSSPAGTALGITGAGTATLGIGTVNRSAFPVKVQDLDVFSRFDPTGKGFVMLGAPLALDCVISLSWIHREMRTCVR
jgi:hypothetical protein